MDNASGHARGTRTTTYGSSFDPFAAAKRAATRFVGPGGGVAPALRQPFGSYREWAEPSAQRDFLYEATGFRHEWGTPPPYPGFVWNAERYLYEPVRQLAARGRQQGAPYSYYRTLAKQGFYVQPHRISDDERLPDWLQWGLRLVRTEEPLPSLAKPYAHSKLSAEEFTWKPPPGVDRSDPELEGLSPYEVSKVMRQRMEERAARMDSLGWLPAGKFRTAEGGVIDRYGPGEWMKDAREITSWEEYMRDPTFGGRVVPRLGVNLAQHPDIVRQQIEKRRGLAPTEADIEMPVTWGDASALLLQDAGPAPMPEYGSFFKEDPELDYGFDDGAFYDDPYGGGFYDQADYGDGLYDDEAWTGGGDWPDELPVDGYYDVEPAHTMLPGRMPIGLRPARQSLPIDAGLGPPGRPEPVYMGSGV